MNGPKSESNVLTLGGVANQAVRPFEVGTLVYLKSGSPAMTVSDLNSGNRSYVVTVDWFDLDHFAHRNEYHKDQLTTEPSVLFRVPDGGPVFWSNPSTTITATDALDTAQPEREDTLQDTMRDERSDTVS